jgi:hypothetical protein
MKILLGDLNAKVGTEDIFKPTIGNESLLEISNDNGVGVVNFATSKNLIATEARCEGILSTQYYFAAYGGKIPTLVPLMIEVLSTRRNSRPHFDTVLYSATTDFSQFSSRMGRCCSFNLLSSERPNRTHKGTCKHLVSLGLGSL